MQHLNIKRKESKQGKIITTKLALDLDKKQDIREIESKLRMQNLKIQATGNRHERQATGKKHQEGNRKETQTLKIIQLNWITIVNSQAGIKEDCN
ncbi:MAG: hypothetical protein PHX21_07750 [bacterium]|nr:hypothetical protein [bacterium]